MTAPQYTLTEAMSACIAICQRCLAEVRALARIPGPPGEQGPPGPPGRNATDIKLIEELVEQKVRLALKAAAVTTSDGGRTMLWSIGGMVHEVRTAIVLDAGIWKEGNYSQGDGVSFDGQFWIAQADTKSKPPSSDWRLAVRSGRNGKDLRPEEQRAAEPIRFK